MKLIYFATLREQLGIEEEQLEKPEQVGTVAELIACLKARGKKWQQSLAAHVLIAVNQEMASPELVLEEGDEIALFPPVTGG